MAGVELCVICQENLTEQDIAYPDTCPSHRFHKSCLEQWAKMKNVCPIDNKSFVVIVGLDGSQCIIQPRENGDEETSSGPDFMQFMQFMNFINQQFQSDLFGQFIIRTQQAGDGFQCSICKTSNLGERAKVVPCEHEFHRSCIMNRAGRINVCPQRGCNLEFHVVLAQTGFQHVQTSPLVAVTMQVTAPPGFRCCVCQEPSVQRMRAIALPCRHLQHRGCLLEYVGQHRKCPQCNHPSTKVFCSVAGVIEWD